MANLFGPDKSYEDVGIVPDPFMSPSGPTHLRYGNYDEQLFALGPGASAEQARHALQAHLRDTERRMEEAGKLGTMLVQQQRELTDRLREVEQLESEEMLNPDLRQKLLDIEKDYNEVAKESARAFLPKQRVPSNETSQGSPFAPEGKGGRRSVSPSKFESLATGSPAKLSVPNRKLRNQPTNRVHDIEFAAEISTSLISQVRNLQALLAERDEELRDIKVDRAKLELEVEGFQERMKSLDESEHRYKDENWNLETQIHDLMAAQRESADREKKLQQTLSVLQAEKNATQRELDEVKDNLAKQEEKNAVAVKNLEIELGTSRRNAAMMESERFAMQRKVDDLTAQNQELARAFSVQRGRLSDRESGFGMSDEDFLTVDGRGTPEHSPPPSPVKGTPARHSMLESETLKTSLQHAQRTLQTLRSNVHREKTEKLELKRMLQEARDELEKIRNEPNVANNRRSRKVEARETKKAPKLAQLGGPRVPKTELYVEDPDWEDHGDSSSPPSRLSQNIGPIAEASSDQFETAAETSDAFETAHERETETDDFQTGAEDMSDDGEATETEASPSKGRQHSSALHQPGRRLSFHSTASTSDDDDYGPYNLKTPSSHLAQKMRHRLSRGTMGRRSRRASEEPTFQSSPASFANSSASGTPQAPSQSLYAELEDLDGSDDESTAGAPSVRSVRSLTPGSTARGRTSPPPEMPALPRVIMVDSAMMTEPVHVQPLDGEAGSIRPTLAPLMVDSGNNTDEVATGESALSPKSAVFQDRPTSMSSVIAPGRFLGDEFRDGEHSRPLSMFSYSDASAQYDPEMMTEKLAQFPSPPTSPPKLGLTPATILPPRQHLSLSSIESQYVEPEVEEETFSVPPSFTQSTIVSQDIEPVIEPEKPAPPPPNFSMSTVLSQQVEPLAGPELPTIPPPVLSMPAVVSQHIEPVVEPSPVIPPHTVSNIVSQEVEPVAEPEVPVAPPAVLSMASLVSEHVEPLAEPETAEPPAPALTFSSTCAEHIEPVEGEPLVAEREPEAAFVAPLPVPFSFSSVVSEHFEPRQQDETPPALPVPLSFSAIQAEGVEPIREPDVQPPTLSFSAVQAEQFEPYQEPEPIPATPVKLSFASIQATEIEPLQESEPKAPSPADLSFSSIHTEKVAPRQKPELASPVFTLASVLSQEVKPLPAEKHILPAPLLGFSIIHGIGVEPMESRSPKRDGFIIPRDIEDDEDFLAPHTPPNHRLESKLAVGKGKNRAREEEIPIIAEDDTRQSPSGSVLNETPESQRPFRELSGNTDSRQTRKPPLPTVDHSSQTALTAEAIDHIIKAKTRPAGFAGQERGGSFIGSVDSPSNVRVHRPQSRDGNQESPTRSKGKMVDIGVETRRPGSAASFKASLSSLPPLPANHKEAIEAAKTGSSSGGQGTMGSMGPPLFPASAMRNNINRPLTPGSPRPMSPSAMSGTLSSRGGPTPRAPHGTADVHTPNMVARDPSRKSSVSSFASEIDTRFNMYPGLTFDGRGLEPTTDTRMIQAITQTMIGEYLWKYTRRAGRGGLSENRHRRFFWVHPYTRTLYWSDRDPAGGNRAELRAKSVPIEAVRVVTDDNPMPPGLHRKSLIVIAPGRSIKFTATTGQRHEIWFNALSYLLLRTNEEGQHDTEEMAGSITREDVAEFNPSYNTRHVNGSRPPAAPSAPSLSSYNSRTTRNESPAVGMSMNVPTLTPSNKKPSSNRPSLGTMSRISGYWKDSKVISGTFGGLRSRSGASVQPPEIYEASQVHDSAEDLREMIEQQDRDADRLENVRACCDGKHDVGTLTHSSKRGRHMHPPAHTHAGPSASPTPVGTVSSRA